MTGLVYRKLRAPQQDGEQFLEPPISDFPRLWEQNRRLSSQSWSIPHKSLRQMMLDARLELLQLAGVPRSPITGGLPPVVMTGHQPELFHPGVWCKNFVVGELAKRVGAAAIHVVMDNDAAGDPAIKIPDFNGRSWHQKRVAYDVTVAAVPHEQRFPVDRRLFDTFGTRVAASIEPLVSNPLVREMWPTAVSTADQGLPIGDCIVAARRQLEQRCGLNLAVVNMSALAQTRAFASLSLQLIDMAATFRRLHNDVLRQYREVHRIRSPQQPIPDLRIDGDWIELPCWVWTADAPIRQPVFARSGKNYFEISDQATFAERFEGTDEGTTKVLIEQWIALTDRGVKLRPRAILSTLFFRLLLSDWFVHGIGGGKYDQITDEIIQRLFGLTPPVFQIATSTRQLSRDHVHVDEAQLRTSAKLLRDLKFHAEKHVPNSQTARQLVAEKRLWTTGDSAATHSAKQRHDELMRINAALQPLVETKRADVQARLDQDRNRLDSCRVLESREYSFCLFPEHELANILRLNL